MNPIQVLLSLQVYNITAKYIMKCDDDTFVRIDSILEEVQEKAILQGLYMGNMNEGHWPLRSGKWAVTVEVCFHQCNIQIARVVSSIRRMF